MVGECLLCNKADISEDEKVRIRGLPRPIGNFTRIVLVPPVDETCAKKAFSRFDCCFRFTFMLRTKRSLFVTVEVSNYESFCFH